jgi:arsenate reductase
MPNKGVEIIDYVKNPLSKTELTSLIKKIGITPLGLVRKGEKIWKENFKGKELTDNEIIDAMVSNPKLIERPIVETTNKALICRPPELALELIEAV